MKSKLLQRTEIFGGALLLTLLLACNPAKQSEAEPQAAEATPAKESVATPTATAGTLTYVAQPLGSKVKMEGTSTIHDWSMESLVVGGSLDCDAGFPESALTDPKAAKPTVQVFMPVRSFKSNSKKMDEVMQEHMKETQFKRIEYKLTELKPKSPAGATGPLQFEASGELTIAGKTRTITMPVTIERKEGKLNIKGSTQLKMTDYGVEPPAPKILGMSPLKTGDDLKITFEWVLAPKA